MAVTRRRLIAVLIAAAVAAVMGAGGPLAAELKALDVYQRFGSPISARVGNCRYQPTCSHFAREVLTQDGFWRGNLRIAARLAMCSPLGALWDSLSSS